jgi:hypothetical protein
MNELFAIISLAVFGGILVSDYLDMSPANRLRVRYSALGQAEGLHNLRCNCFIFSVAALTRGNWIVSAGAALCFALTFLWAPQPTKVQGGTAATETGFYASFALVLPPRLAAITFSQGALPAFLGWLAAACVAGAIVLLALPNRRNSAFISKMKSVLAPGHNAACVLFLVLITPVVGAATFGWPHLASALVLIAISLIRGKNSEVRFSQLAFFMHWPLPLLGGRLPAAIFLLGGSPTIKTLIIFAASAAVWSWAIGFNKPSVKEKLIEASRRPRDR